ncbi:type II toxin-antitoxin system PemK/MazF family toxin [Nakamurella deserti]|uniref:type II toxin-antitoxin system PemK/MazF family toxin n=1 Tax=Nakamurella deserti TaxID=2164074 RepID=UPI000DBE23C5|nr:type II toxin-antitoxin system PemK/MazF family toxin [Nakamurella deserti]
MARSFLADLASSLLTSVLGRGRAAPAAPPARRPPAPRAPRPAPDAPVRGRSGGTATVEVDPGDVGRVRMTYSPDTDGNPDPGEIVWTWVPYEEKDGRGKDRPVLVVATESTGTVLAVQLTSKAHTGDGEFVALGSGAWDAEGRPSWVDLDRVFRVHPEGMRREATALDARRYGLVEAALTRRYHWS